MSSLLHKAGNHEPFYRTMSDMVQQERTILQLLKVLHLSVSDIADNFPLRKIVDYICFMNRFNHL